MATTRTFAFTLTHVLAVGAGVALALYFKGRSTAVVVTPSANSSFMPASTSLRFTAIQRGTHEVPGWNRRASLRLSDITSGRVEVHVVDEAGTTLASATLREGESLDFSLASEAYSLRLESLQERTIGDDHAVFVVERAQPKPALELDTAAAIERLLAKVASSDVIFIRNGTQHTPQEAADHLRRKWSPADAKLATVERFIAEAGTRSSVSGEAYTVRLPDGREVESRAWLTELSKSP